MFNRLYGIADYYWLRACPSTYALVSDRGSPEFHCYRNEHHYPNGHEHRNTNPHTNAGSTPGNPG